MITRRDFVQKGLAALASASIPLTSFAASKTQSEKTFGNTSFKRMVVIFLEGGFDGYQALTPADPLFNRSAKTHESFAAHRRIRLADGRLFLVHPALEPLVALHGSGVLHFQHEVGHPSIIKNHSAATDRLFSRSASEPGKTWMDRADLFLASSFNTPAPGIFRPSFLGTPTETGNLSAQDHSLNTQLHAVARKINDREPFRLASVTDAGWDIHVDRAGQAGLFYRKASQLARALTTFWSLIESWQQETLVLAVSEFGRSTVINSMAGTDHGWGTCSIILSATPFVLPSPEIEPDLSRFGSYDGSAVPVSTDVLTLIGSLMEQHFETGPVWEIFRHGGHALPI